MCEGNKALPWEYRACFASHPEQSRWVCQPQRAPVLTGFLPFPSLQQSKVVLLEDLASQVGLRTQVSPSRWPAPWNMATGSVRLSEGDRLKDGSLVPLRKNRLGIFWRPRNLVFLLDRGKRKKLKPHHSSSPCKRGSPNSVTLTTLLQTGCASLHDQMSPPHLSCLEESHCRGS